MFRELSERASEPSVRFIEHAAPPDAALDDVSAWHAANPGLADGIKSLSYMRDAARRALASPADQSTYRAHDLNQPQSPAREMIVGLSDWQACIVPPDDEPERAGECVIGFDLGGSSSMTALVAVWPRTGRIEAWGAFPSIPALSERSRADGQGELYPRMRERGEIVVYEGRVTPAAAFLQDCAARLSGERVVVAGADRYRKAEAMDALSAAGVSWPIEWRGQGASATADGSADVRAFQRLVLSRKLRLRESLLLASAIAESSIRRDVSGNPAIAKAREHGRIDALSAAVIACGLAERVLAKPERRELRSVLV
jgi:phage terminase large subunit-like protein